MIFQDPYASLNPRKRVGQIVGDPLRLHGHRLRRRSCAGRFSELLDRVGLSSEHYNRFPHEFSGGPAPADRDRPRPRAAPEADRRRRAGLGARRLDPGADHQPPRRPPGRVRALLHLRRPRSRRRASRLRSDRGHVPGEGRRGGSRLLSSTARPVHPYTRGAALGGADSRPEGERRANAARPRGRRAEPGRSAGRLPFSHPLPVGNRDLQRRLSLRWRSTTRAGSPPAITRATSARRNYRRPRSRRFRPRAPAISSRERRSRLAPPQPRPE